MATATKDTSNRISQVALSPAPKQMDAMVVCMNMLLMWLFMWLYSGAHCKSNVSHVPGCSCFLT